MSHRCSYCKSACLGSRIPEPQPSPDIAQLLTSNEQPSDLQEAEFRQVRLEGRKRLAVLDAEIEEEQQRLVDLLAQRDGLAWKIEHHNLVLNPVRRIPPDILRTIFSFATSIGISPYQITAICRSWRHVATSFSCLWRQINFTVPYPRKDYHRGHHVVFCSHLDLVTHRASSLATYLRNADRCPLLVDLPLDYNFSFNHLLYPLLILSACRIQQLRILTEDLRVLDGLPFRHIAGDLTSLETIELVFDPARTIIPPDAISFPKTLRSLIVVPYPCLSIPTIDMAWDYIERLELRVRYLGATETSSRSVKEVLSRTSQLLSLTLSDRWDSNGTPTGNSIPVPQVISLPIETPFNLPQLLELFVECGNPHVYDVLDNMMLPSLDRLVIPAASPEILSHLENTLRQSHCNLTRLTVHLLEVTGVDMTPMVSFLRLCGALHELSVLSIKMLSDARDVLGALINGNGTSLPSLRVLAMDVSSASYEGHADSTAFIERVFEMLELRCGDSTDNFQLSPARLESFALHAPCASTFLFTSAHDERIRALRHSGLKLYICRYAPDDPRMY
ncbi:hypothetical protein BDZ89DRAFT_1158151 [Hymenopellis radicata]|nr:hypothetical protein BDZ89DRAFT_1158151 [Hymenopellis radicata]